MSYSAKIVLDSIQPDGVRLTTMEVTFPKFILAEFNTHRQFSRNSASSRAIPFEKMVQRVMEDPVLPVWWGKNQAGMQAQEELVDIGQPVDGPPLPYIKAFPRTSAINDWLVARDMAVSAAQRLAKIGVHKQIVNRLIEPWLFTTVIVSSTSYNHFFALRCHPDAQPEMRHTAELMREAYQASTPRQVKYEGWHMPYVNDNEDYAQAIEMTPDPAGNPAQKFRADVAVLLRKVSVARCARVSYLAQDGTRDLQKDIDLHDRLATSGHWSPFEHVAQAVTLDDSTRGNFDGGWAQYRKSFPGEFTP